MGRSDRSASAQQRPQALATINNHTNEHRPSKWSHHHRQNGEEPQIVVRLASIHIDEVVGGWVGAAGVPPRGGHKRSARSRHIGAARAATPTGYDLLGPRLRQKHHPIPDNRLLDRRWWGSPKNGGVPRVVAVDVATCRIPLTLVCEVAG